MPNPAQPAEPAASGLGGVSPRPASTHLDRGSLERLDAHLREEAVDLALLQHAGPEVLRRLRPAGDREAQAVLRVAAPVAGRHEPGQQGVARADRGDRLERLEGRPGKAALASLAEHRQAAVGERDDPLPRSHLDHLAERAPAVLLVSELVAHEALRLELVRADHVRAPARGQQERLALPGEHGRHSEPAHLLHQAPVEPRVDPARQAAREHAHGGALGQVQELVHEQVELLVRDVRAVLVDLGLLAAGGVDYGGRGGRLLADAHEVVEDALVGQVLDDARARGPARDPGGDHRLAERAEGARDVHPLAARHRRLLHGAVAPSEPEVRHGQRLVDRGVEGDGDDHRRTSRTRRRRVSAASATPSRMAMTSSTVKGTPNTEVSTLSVPASGTSARVTRAIRATRSPSTKTLTEPTPMPLGMGPSSSPGARTRRRTRSPSRSVSTMSRDGTSAARSSRYSMSARAITRRSSRTRPRWKRAMPQRSSFSVSASRAASLGSPITTEITRAPPRPLADPIST